VVNKKGRLNHSKIGYFTNRYGNRKKVIRWVLWEYSKKCVKKNINL